MATVSPRTSAPGACSSRFSRHLKLTRRAGLQPLPFPQLLTRQEERWAPFLDGAVLAMGTAASACASRESVRTSSEPLADGLAGRGSESPQTGFAVESEIGVRQAGPNLRRMPVHDG